MNTEYDDKHTIIKEWHTNGTTNLDMFATKYNTDINNINVINEYNEHIVFADTCEINGTPRMLFNGYLVSSPYSIIDIYQMYKNS